jgi:hypothetical protein
MQDKQIPSGSFKIPFLQRFFKEISRGWEIRKQCSPGSDFGFARALDDDVEVLRKGGEKGDDAGKEGCFRGRVRVDFFVEHGVQEDFEGVGKVFEGGVLMGEVEGGGGVEAGEVETEDLGDEEMGLGMLLVEIFT